MNDPRRPRLLAMPTALFPTFLLLAIVLAGALVPAQPALAFSDVPPDHAYALAIDELASRGIVSGRLDGTFAPEETTSRCQFAKMIVNTLGIPPEGDESPFTDVGPGDLPEFVAAAARHGITNGTNPAGTLFSPWKKVSRAQVLTMVVRGMNDEYPGLLGWIPGIAGGWLRLGSPHSKNASTAWGNRLLERLPEMSSLDPWAPMPRGEVAQVLGNALSIIDRAALVTEVVDGNTVRAEHRGTIETIELLGVDAPELDEPYGLEARDRLAELVAHGRFLRLQFDTVTRDDSGHVLAYVLYDSFPGWALANTSLLREGLARLDLVYANLRYEDDLRAAETHAKDQRLGIWSLAPDS